MARFVIDPPAAIELARGNVDIAAGHQLVAPSALRSQCLSIMYRAVRNEELPAAEAWNLLDHITSLRIRLLNDRVSRAQTWRVAALLGSEDTAEAEYIAVGQLQADYLIALDPGLATRAGGLIALAPLAALGQEGWPPPGL
ncbi:hypothetical protein JOF48_000024 [Arthrobacter stackebrandtii]|uniref:Uncharacterized protein n=1 Tax=Arthrobacter stackebrandtii TaxID=272161 RepID=A0ABS4YRK1_9MICC|nr:hypothetical protein [Arthrobacter stackebrandtii]MBP2411225.1 hypothetical protein [Arthrobacter stackebrandtii]PYH00064.1 hypothetical protein CVV67_11490 [Arthrobacter stackebrandtii]